MTLIVRSSLLLPGKDFSPGEIAVVAASVAAAGATAIGAGIVSPTGEDTPSAYAEELLAVARAAPRLLVTADGWSVVRADGEAFLDLHWRPVAEHQAFLDDRAAAADPPSDITVAGSVGTLFRYTGTEDFTALWIDGEDSVELRGGSASEAEFCWLPPAWRCADRWRPSRPWLPVCSCIGGCTHSPITR